MPARGPAHIPPHSYTPPGYEREVSPPDAPAVGLVHALVSLGDGSAARLFPGDVIGRLWRADLQVNHPAVSELHAYVSHRDGRLWLLPLRGTLKVYGMASREVALKPGLEVELAPGVVLAVDEVSVPGELPALSLDGRVHPLHSERVSLGPDGPGALGARGAFAECWSDGEGWFVRDTAGEVQRLTPGETLTVDGHALAWVDVRAPSAEARPTEGRSELRPLRLVAQFETVRIHRGDASAVHISGLQARALSLLAEYGGPVHWELVARELWRNVDDSLQLRRRWDRVLWALRRRLRAEGLRSDLVLTTQGQVELALTEHDTLEIAT